MLSTDKIKNAPLVSIIMPAYNAQGFIERSLGSACEQTYSNIEIIVIDDGSTDRTADIIKSYQDHRIRYFYQSNQGQGVARNKGIVASKGEYITFLDADDRYLPDKVLKQVQLLASRQEYDANYCNAFHYYDTDPDKLLKKSRDFPSGDIFSDLLRSSLINPNTVMFKRHVLERFQFKDGAHGRYAEEWELYLKIARAGHTFGHINEELVVVEVRSDSNTQWDTQWIIKKNTLEMLENIFSQMTDKERETYKADEIIKMNKIKLVVAYLISMKKKESFKVIHTLYPKPLAYLLITLLALAPARLLKDYLMKSWKKRQIGSFSTTSLESRR